MSRAVRVGTAVAFFATLSLPLRKSKQIASLNGYFHCYCLYCGGPFEFPEHGLAQQAPCPHCHNLTTLYDVCRPASGLGVRRENGCVAAYEFGGGNRCTADQL